VPIDGYSIPLSARRAAGTAMSSASLAVATGSTTVALAAFSTAR
jgi:hypothetical protein